MDIKKMWNNADWTLKARQIIEAINKFPADNKITLVLRHSHRNEPKANQKLHKLRLTEKGHEIAKNFGRKLPKSRFVNFFHSIVWRCQETAEDILEGFKEVSGEGEIKGVLKPLFFAGTAPNFFIEIFKNGSPLQFLHQWAVGHFSPKFIMPFKEYSKLSAQVIWRKLEELPENGMNIHITHDIFLIALRYGWFAIPPSIEWVPFLGGFAFILRDEDIFLFNDNQFLEIKHPHWWKGSK